MWRENHPTVHILWHHAISPSKVSSELAEGQGKGEKKIVLH